MAASLAGGRLEELTCAQAQLAVQAIFCAYSGNLCVSDTPRVPDNADAPKLAVRNQCACMLPMWPTTLVRLTL